MRSVERSPFSQIWRNGASKALATILTPIAWSPVTVGSGARKYVEPPPATTPSSIAAFVAHIASSILSFFSASSISELAPTYIIATPPPKRAALSLSRF